MNLHRPILLAAIALALPAAAFAQASTSAPTVAGITPDNLVQWLTPLLVPLLIAGFKRVAPSIPSLVLPILAPVLGVAIDVAAAFATSHQSNFVLAAVLGLAGVGLRELKENIAPAQNGGWPPSEKPPFGVG